MPDYTSWLNASTASRDEEMFAGLYAELHSMPSPNTTHPRRSW